MNALTGKKYLLVWIAIPLIAILLYHYVENLHNGLKWFATGLSLLVVFFSIVIHEISHGLASLRCGDQTAQKARRLTLNPIEHVSGIGSILLPLILFITHAPAVLGWAKPVPLNPMELREYPRDQIFTVLAGPLSNFVLAYLSFLGLLCAGFIFSLLYPGTDIPLALNVFEPIEIGKISFKAFWFVLFHLLNAGLFVNLSLGVFNLLPFPPLDGFWLFKTVFPAKVTAFLTKIQIWGFILIIIAIQTKLFSFFMYPIVLTYSVSIGLLTFLLR